MVEGCGITEKYYPLYKEAGVELSFSSNKLDEILEKSKGIPVVVKGYGLVMPADFIGKLDPAVKCIVNTSIGYDKVDVDACNKKGIMVCNCPDYSTQEVAVFATGLIINCVRKITMLRQIVRTGKWDGNFAVAYPSRRLSVLTLGLMGFGNIARLVATYAKTMGMTLVAYDPFIDEKVFAEYGVKKVTADELYAVSDVVTYHIPLFEATRNIFNREALAKMKDGVIIINTARGGLIDEEAMCEGLDSGKVAAAAIDVTAQEPTPKDHPYMKYDNVILTPHAAFQSSESNEDRQRLCTATAIAAAKGEVPYSCVNRKALSL